MKEPWSTTVHLRLRERREELDLTENELAERMAIEPSMYWDMEASEAENYLVHKVEEFKRLCAILDLDLLDLFDIECAFCGAEPRTFLDVYRLPRHELQEARRGELGLSRAELGERYDVGAEVVVRLEENPEYMEGGPMQSIMVVSEVLDVPPQLLLGVKCRKCGR